MNNNINSVENILPESGIERKQRLLRSFGENDKIYEEFHCTNLEELDEEIIFLDNWKTLRGHGAIWLLKCFLQSFTMVVLCCLLVSSLSILIMYVDLNTVEVCFEVKWDKLPEKLKQVYVTVQVLGGCFLQFFHIGVMIFVFGFKLVDELHLLHLNVVAAFVDSVYHLFFQVYNNYDWKPKRYFLNAIFVSVMLVNSYTLAKYFSIQRARKFILTMQLGVQFMLGSTLMFLTIYVFNPWFVAQGRPEQRIVAAVVPFLGIIIAFFTRLTIQNIQINHPGTTYMLIAGTYIGTSMCYRTIQAQLQETHIFIIICLIQSSMGLVNQVFTLFYKPLFRWLYVKILQGESYTINDPIKTPRSQRLMADVVICNIISETNALIYTNAFVQLYAMQINHKNNENEVLKDFLIRTFSAITIEYVFSVIAIFIFTWFKNIPVLRVWREKWKTFLGVHLFICGSMAIYSTHYLTGLVAGQVREDQSRNNTLSCDLSESVFF